MRNYNKFPFTLIEGRVVAGRVGILLFLELLSLSMAVTKR